MKKIKLHKAKFLLLSALLFFVIALSAQNYPAYSSINWKGVYVTGTTGGDGTLAAAFDGLTTSGDKYGSNGVFPVVVTAHFPAPTVLTTYSFTTISWNELGRSPKTWKVEASNDGTAWTQLDEVVGYTNFTATYQTREFTFVNSTAYRIYRIVIREIGSGTIFGVTEIGFPEYTGTGLAPWFPEKPVTPIGTTRQLHSERAILRCYADSVVLNAVVYTNKAESPITEAGVVYGSTPNPAIDNATKQVSTVTTEAFTTKITGLTAGTMYYIRPYATNANGTTYGQEFAVSTSDAEGVVFTTSAPANVSSFRAELPVNVLTDGGAAITERGVVWSESANPTIENGSVFTDTEIATGLFNGKLTALTPATLYYVRPYIKNANGLKYGAQYAFYSSNVEKFDWKNGVTVETDWSVENWSWGNSLQKAFNKNTGNFWVYKGVNAYLQFNFSEPQVLTQYIFTPNAGTIARAPKDWTLVASNDKQNWVTLDTQAGITDWTGTTTKTFDFSNATAYSYYRINFTAPQSGDIYRVATFDFPQYTGTVSSVNTLFEEDKLKVRANKGSIVVVNNEQLNVDISIYNISGVCVRSLASSDSEIVFNNIPHGFYLLKLEYSGKMQNAKVLIK